MDHALISHHVVHDTISISNAKQKRPFLPSSLYAFYRVAVNSNDDGGGAFSMSGQKLMRSFLININRNERDFDVLFTRMPKYLFDRNSLHRCRLRRIRRAFALFFFLLPKRVVLCCYQRFISMMKRVEEDG